MKGKKMEEMPPSTRIYTCIPTCKKGIYETYQMEVKRGKNYQMQAFSDNSVLSNTTVTGGSI